MVGRAPEANPAMRRERSCGALMVTSRWWAVVLCQGDTGEKVLLAIVSFGKITKSSWN